MDPMANIRSGWQACATCLLVRNELCEPMGKILWTSWTKQAQADQSTRMSLILHHGERQLAALMPGDKDGAHLFSDWNRFHGLSRRSSNLAGPDHNADHEWSETTGWANYPSWSQSKRAKPTYTDPEDDRRVDRAMPSGSTSKTWNQPRIMTSGQTTILLKIQDLQQARQKLCHRRIGNHNFMQGGNSQTLLGTPLKEESAQWSPLLEKS